MDEFKQLKELKSQFVTIGPVKLFADGSIGVRTAFMTENYINTSNNGVQLYKTQELFNLVEFYNKNGFKVAIHAIGDAANQQITDIYKSLPGNAIIHA